MRNVIRRHWTEPFMGGVWGGMCPCGDWSGFECRQYIIQNMNKLNSGFINKLSFHLHPHFPPSINNPTQGVVLASDVTKLRHRTKTNGPNIEASVRLLINSLNG